MRKRLMAAFAAMLAMVLTVASVRADTIFVTHVPPPVQVGSDFHWNYDVQLAGGLAGAISRLDPGDYFAISDFYGLDLVATAALLAVSHPTWSVLEEPTTPFSDGVTTVTIGTTAAPNVRFTYGGVPLFSDLPLGTFTVVSIYGQSHTVAYGGRDHRASDGSLQFNIGTTQAAFVPLPLAAWGGMALLGVIAGRRAMKMRLS